MTVAFVMSGAANYGSLQVGALQVMLERGIRPDLLIGSSAGAMNAAYLAIDPTPAGALRLADQWRAVAHDVLSRSNRWVMMWRFIANHAGMFPSQPLQRFIERTLPPGVVHYGDLGLPAYATAVRLDTGAIRCFGDDPRDRILDGLMASTSVPGFFPPWVCDGATYFDGGVAAYLPIGFAVARGATEVYALNVDNVRQDVPRGAQGVARRALDFLIQRQAHYEVEMYGEARGVAVHFMSLHSRRDIAFWDFRFAEEMIAEGRQLAAEALGG